MTSSTFVLLCITLSMTHGVLGEVWEFGVDAPGSVIVDHKEGDFTFFQKTKEIKIKAPQCYVIEYVRVQVLNSLSNPTVKYNKLTSTITIDYKTLQYSVSTYNIIAKGARTPGCYNYTADLQMRQKFDHKN